jgi:hypothetical protein
MNILDLSYASWKSLVQAAGWTTYYKDGPRASSASVWAGTAEYPTRASIGSDDHADWLAVFQPTAVLVADQDQAIAHIIEVSLGARFGENRAGDGTLTTSQQILTLGQTAFTRTDNGTEQLGVNGLAAGAAVVAWNGTGIGDTGGDWTPSGQGSETAGSMRSGTNGWDTGVTAGSNLTKFDSGADQDIAGTYDTLSFWMQPKAYPAGSNLKIRWKTNGGGNAGGAELDITNYVTDFDLNVYQKVTIPIGDFGLTGDADKIQFKFAGAGGQHFWFDDIELNTSAGGGPFTFRAQAPVGECWHVSMLVVMLSGPTVDWLITNFANTASLTNGLLIRSRKISTGEVSWTLNCKDNIDLFGRFHPQDDIEFSDGTLLVGFMVKPGLASVIISDDEVVEVVVRDDLAGTSGRAFAHYGVEITA